MGQAVQLEKGRWGRNIDTLPGQHSFDADLNEWVSAFWADAKLDAGTAPQLETSLVEASSGKVEAEEVMSKARPFAEMGKPVVLTQLAAEEGERADLVGTLA